MTDVMRPKTGQPSAAQEKRLAYSSDLHKHLKQNPVNFYPSKIANINKQSTNFNPINFSPSKLERDLVQTNPVQKSSENHSSKNSNYKTYAISSYMQQGRLAAPNYHPVHVKALQNDKDAFKKKSGQLALQLDRGKTAVQREQNQFTNAKRMGYYNMRPGAYTQSQSSLRAGAARSAGNHSIYGSQPQAAGASSGGVTRTVDV